MWVGIVRKDVQVMPSYWSIVDKKMVLNEVKMHHK
jgi:hypothetical protein